MSDDRTLDPRDWDRIQEQVPIACVDFVPVRRGPNGAIAQLGLIRRRSPFGDTPLWCHLGGRILVGETISDALDRHAEESLDGQVSFPNAGRSPLGVVEWFREDRNEQEGVPSRYGIDPRKHALSGCYVAETNGPIHHRAKSNEATDFRWFTPNQVGELSDLWPGTNLVVKHILAGEPDDESRRAAYQVLSDRAQNHNTLVWQTPSLALTAEAFLLTIALGHDYSTAARLIASGLNLMLSLLCLQLMAKHKEMMNLDRDNMMEIEAALRLPPFHGRVDSARLSRLAAMRSSTLWMCGFGMLSVIAVGVFVSAVVAFFR